MTKKICFLFLLVIALFLPRAYAAHVSVVNVDVDEAKIDKIVQTVKDVDAYMKAEFDNRGLRGDVKIIVATDSSKIPRMFSMAELGSDRIGARSRDGLIQVIADTSKSDQRLCFLVAHELVHQYQASAIGGMSFLSHNMWLTEGMADVVAVDVIGDEALERRFLANAKKHAGEGLHLKDVTQKSGWSMLFNKGKHPYAIADRAIWYLANNYPKENLFMVIEMLSSKTAADALMAVYGATMEDIEAAAGISGMENFYLE